MNVILWHARISYSCPCGREHDLEMFGNEQDPVRIVIEGVAERLRRHCKTVRLTTWAAVTDVEGWTTIEDERLLAWVDGEPVASV